MFETLVISGGSTKGFLAIGALHYLEYMGYLSEIKNFYGTSVGSMISLLIAVGYRPIDLVVIFKKTNINIDSLFSKTDCQLFDYDEIMRSFENFFIAKTGKLLTFTEFYERYKKQLFFITFNYSTGNMEILSKDFCPNMSCTQAVRLSCAIPLVFKKCIYQNSLYVDGGFANNFPLDVAVKLQKNGEKILALKIDAEWKGSSGDNFLTVIENVVFAPIILKMKENEDLFSDRCVLVNLVSNISPFNLKLETIDVVKLLNEGYEETRARLNP